GHARLMHRNAHQVICPFHSDLVVRDIDELNLARHLFHHSGIAAHVCIVQRCIHFVEHTKGSRVKAKDGEDQCNGRQRFLSTRKQVTSTVLHTRSTSHNCHARIQQIVTRPL